MSVKRSIQIGLVLVLLLVSFASIQSASAWSGCGSTVRVNWGDTLYRIATRCGTTVVALKAANGIPYYSSTIYAGTYLVIPGGYNDGYSRWCGPTYDYYGAYYVVCRGDTLGGIALYYGTTVANLQQNNYIPNANRIYPGQIIRPW
jgi:LysM repeat protein